jgi:uncharacterized membrane protein (UPF0127 family)
MSYLLAVPAAWAEEIDLQIGIHRIRATIASTPQQRETGLMHHSTLCGNCGMLFVFPRSRKYNFWMKNTPLPLAIAFIAADGSILNIDEMQANSTQTHTSVDEALYALEMNQSWFTAHAIKPGDQVDGLQRAPQGK